MTLDAYLYDPKTGERCVYNDGYVHADLTGAEGEREDILCRLDFFWTEHNYSCDCNRRRFICLTLHDDDCECPEEHKCGQEVVLEKLVWHETGEELLSWKDGELVKGWRQ